VTRDSVMSSESTVTESQIPGPADSDSDSESESPAGQRSHDLPFSCFNLKKCQERPWENGPGAVLGAVLGPAVLQVAFVETQVEARACGRG
jgi:hypothetical protein